MFHLRKHLRFAVLATTLLSSLNSLADSVTSVHPNEDNTNTESSVVEMPKTWWGRLGRDLVAPFSEGGLPILLVGSVATVATYPARGSVNDFAEDQALGKSSGIGYRLGFWQAPAIYIAGIGAVGLLANDTKYQKDAIFALRVVGYTALVTTGLKGLQLEERPRGGGDMNSFPSGHSSNAFALAGAIARNHGWVAGVPAMAVATFVGMTRVNDRAHYPHDVVFGATIGLSYAFGLDREFSWGHEQNLHTVAFSPLLAERTLGVGAQLKF